MVRDQQLSVFTQRKGDRPGNGGQENVVLTIYRDYIETLAAQNTDKTKKCYQVTETVTRQGMHRCVDLSKANFRSGPGTNKKMHCHSTFEEFLRKIPQELLSAAPPLVIIDQQYLHMSSSKSGIDSTAYFQNLCEEKDGFPRILPANFLIGKPHQPPLHLVELEVLQEHPVGLHYRDNVAGQSVQDAETDQVTVEKGEQGPQG